MMMASYISVVDGIRSRGYGMVWRVMRRINRGYDDGVVRINIGAGKFVRRGWKNLDHADPSGHYAKAYNKECDYDHDLASFDRLPFGDRSVDMIYCSHTIEHLPQKHVRHLFRELHRVMRLGGTVRISVPDYDMLYNALVTGDPAGVLLRHYGKGTIYESFLDAVASYHVGRMSREGMYTLMFESDCPEDFADSLCSSVPEWHQKENPGSHVSWWNYAKLSNMLLSAGFDPVFRSYRGMSTCSDMRPRGWIFNTGFDGTHPEISLYVEGVR